MVRIVVGNVRQASQKEKLLCCKPQQLSKLTTFLQATHNSWLRVSGVRFRGFGSRATLRRIRIFLGAPFALPCSVDKHSVQLPSLAPMSLPQIPATFFKA